MVEAHVGDRLRERTPQNYVNNTCSQYFVVFDHELLERKVMAYRRDACIIEICRIFLPKIDIFERGPRPRQRDIEPRSVSKRLRPRQLQFAQGLQPSRELLTRPTAYNPRLARG